MIPNSLWKHVNDIIDVYNGKIPLSIYLKNYYKKFPILGSRDRKMLSAIVFNWYRFSKGIPDWDFDQAVHACLGMAKDYGNYDGTLSDVFPFEISKLFPFDIDFSDGITKDEWLQSMLLQPRLFLRIRKEKELIKQNFENNQVVAEWLDDNIVSLVNGTNVESILPHDAYVIQDYSSQMTGQFFEPQKQETWYDCCCGAGGKSLLLKDLEPSVKLTVSDNRESILHNLKVRFDTYLHAVAEIVLMDVANESELLSVFNDKKFDNIICDVPCSGSGTWARTPEQLYFYKPTNLLRITERQIKLVSNVVKYLKNGGRLIYITCSVFKEENETVVQEVMDKCDLKLITHKLINGTQYLADSMYVAVLQKIGY